MATPGSSSFLAVRISRKQISRSLAVILTLTLLQFTGVIQVPSSFAAAGSVGSTTPSGTCASSVGETTYVAATYVNDAFCLLKFSTSTTWTVPSGINTVEMLVVGGGGGGGQDGGGGGGGGEVRVITGISVTAGWTATVTVGTGGRGGRWLSPGYSADPGNSSSVVLNGTTYTAVGGAGAAGATASASPSYALGGYSRAGGSGGTALAQSATASNTSKGGRTAIQTTGTASQDATSIGYDGPTTSFTGTSMAFGGGGGGGIWSSSKTAANFGGAAGGAGGGGTGATHTANVGSNAGQPGTDGLGGGGGGGSASDDGGTNDVDQRTRGGKGGDGVVYIKFVPAISITTHPQSQIGAIGSTVTFTATPFTALTGGVTRTKQWQSLAPGGSWTDISGATSDSFVTPTLTRSNQSYQYRYVVTDTYGTASSTTYSNAATLTVPPPLLLGETDTALTSSGGTSGNTTLVGADELTPSASDDFTFAAWIYPTSTCASTRCTILSRERAYRLTILNGNLSFIFWNNGVNNWGSWVDLPSGAIPTNKWSHIALTRNGTSIKVFLNGFQIASSTQTYVPYPNEGVYTLYVGTIYGGSEYFLGAIDEVKIWKSDRSASISTDMNSNASSGGGLVGYWNFNEGSGSTAYNQVLTATAATDFSLNAPAWNSSYISTQSSLGPYTVRKFLRTYITSAGGWKSPVGVSRATVLAVGGGGGGGSRHGGGGGAGGLAYGGSYPLTPSTVYAVTVGVGGIGYGRPGNNAYVDGSGNYTTYKLGPAGGMGTAGTNSLLRSTLSNFDSITALGGGGGSGTSSTSAGGSGGGSNQSVAGGIATQYSGTNWIGYGNNGGQGSSGSCSSDWCGGGGGGAGSAGVNGNFNSNGKAGNGGDGRDFAIESTTATFYAGGGGGASKNGNAGGGIGGSGIGGNGGTAAAGTAGADGTGSGGGAGGFDASQNDYAGGNGGSGIVLVRWITASKPIFTQPTIDTTTAGLVDTITVSANPIAPLIRTYQWQSSTDTGTTWSNISAGTGSGATSQTYTTPILETNTSGIRYQYRVIVTDSDTAGLSITDTSTAVYIVINPRISITGTYTVQKYGVAHTDTFTVNSATGTGTKTITFANGSRTGITWNTSLANNAALSIAATLGPGTYYDTITATDTKGATGTLAVNIVVSKADTITVSAISVNDTYTGTTLNFSESYTISGLVNSDTVTTMTWSYSGTQNGLGSYGPTASKPVNAGSYTLTPVPTIRNSDSYTAVVVNTAPVTINRATRTISISGVPTSLKYGSQFTPTGTPSAGAGDGSIYFTSNSADTCTVISTSIRATKSTSRCFFSATISRGANYETATNSSGSVSLIKADTISVTVNSITPVTYTGNPASIAPTVTISGLVNSDTASATPVTYSYTSAASGSTCATGGTCAVGDLGPGGGYVFYVAPSQQSWGRYLEAAPANWSGTADNDTGNIAKWCVAAPSVDDTKFGNLPDGIGQGYANTYNSVLNVCTGGAIYKARNYRGAGFTNWYLPTGAELAIMAQSSNRTKLGLINDVTKWGYWGSSEDPSTGYIGSLVTSSWGIGVTVKGEASMNFLRPIRAFSPNEVSGTTYSSPPTDADTYTVKAAGLSLSAGSLSDYQGVSYIDGMLRINRALQNPLIIAQYGAIFGSPYKLIIIGGSGTGALSQSVSTGTAGSCSISGDTVTATTVGTCYVTVTKAQDKNYETATASIYIYFLNFVVDQPSPPAGSGSTIALGGATSLTKDPNSAPTISSLSTYTATAGSTQLIITGGFFDHLNPAGITVEFWRGVAAPSFSVSASDDQITVTVPIDARTGKVIVVTPNGTAVSTRELTITP